MLYYYARVRTNKEYKSFGSQTFHCRLDFLEALNKWNRTGGDDWLYYEISEEIFNENMR